MAPMPVQTPFGKRYVNQEVMIDEGMMRKISAETGGQYFRATGNSRLKDIYTQIDKLEKTKIEVSSYRQYKEEYILFALLAVALLIIEFILRHTLLRTFP
jgi:Ca-activated chloride channel family protein